MNPSATKPTPGLHARANPGRVLRLGLGLVLGLLAGCAAPLPATTWVRLPLQAEAAGPSALPPSQAVWLLVGAVDLPRHLDQPKVLVTGGDGALQALGEARWAEPLSDTITQRLRGDLSQRLQREVWREPLPPGVAPARQLRVTVQDLGLLPGGGQAVLDARWNTADRAGGRPPQVFQRRLQTPVSGPGPQALAQAYRRLVWQLSGAVAETLTD